MYAYFTRIRDYFGVSDIYMKVFQEFRDISYESIQMRKRSGAETGKSVYFELLLDVDFVVVFSNIIRDLSQITISCPCCPARVCI